MEKLFWTIGEVAELLGESVSGVRFWSESFKRYIKPERNAKGNRLYTAQDIEALKEIKYLIRGKGMTIEGAKKHLDADRMTEDRRRLKVLECLTRIRAQLEEIRKNT